MVNLKKNFSFDVELNRAYKDDSGNMHVVGVASDDEKDRTGDRMSRMCVQSMAAQANDRNLPLLDNHRSTFEFGFTHSGMAKRADDGTRTQFLVDFQLDPTFPQANKLYQEVQSGKGTRQMSIGGFIDRNDPDAVEFKEEDGEYVRIINSITLDHIAVTREGHAAVPRTKFMEAMIKDIFGDESLSETRDWVSKAAASAAPDETATEMESKTLTSGTTTAPTQVFNVHINSPEAAKASPTEKTETTVRDLLERSAALKTFLEESARSLIPLLVCKELQEGLRDLYLHRCSALEAAGIDVPEFRTYTEAEFTTLFSDQGLSLSKNWFTPSTEETSMADTAKQDDNASEIENSDIAKTDAEKLAAEKTAAETAEKAKTEATELETAEVSKDLSTGLAMLEKLGAFFNGEQAAAEVPAEIVAVEEALKGLAGLDIEKNSDNINRLRSAFLTLLGETPAEAEAAEKNAPASDDVTQIIEKAVLAAVAKAFEGQGSEAVTKSFDDSFGSLTCAIAKSLEGMGTGFKGMIEKSVADQKVEIEKSNVALQARLAVLEKAGGVRQSAPANAPEVVQGGAGSTRTPDNDNPFRGLFDMSLTRAGVSSPVRG